ncbi:hypothetical protein BS17DRAFT_807511 [Gyrodon lividus]|nr:hypothetical protein BS17DRAFT_807511 [Gyrodon lividus]
MLLHKWLMLLCLLASVVSGILANTTYEICTGYRKESISDDIDICQGKGPVCGETVLGFPLTHKTLKLHIDTLLHARLGEAFPETGVGHNWTDRFTTCHADRIAQYWSSPLDTACGQAVNPHTHKAWCNLLKEMLEREKIEEDCLWAADETGFQPGGRTRQCVFGPAKKKIQHQQHNGNRENITVMVTICADGEDIAPTVIYKGQAFSTNWHQDNELQASHNSHYTKDFLDYARHHNIHVLCYPAHATHIYQGLDVAIFGPLKNCWTEERDQYESSTRQKVTKANFITIYRRAHHAVITPQNICSAFEKTGVWPFNPDMVTPETMAPSLKTSAQGQLPLPQASPVRAINSVMYTTQPQASSSTPGATEVESGETHRGHLQWQAAAKDMVGSLATTSASFFIEKTPLTSVNQLPPFLPSPISPTRNLKHKYALLMEEPRNTREMAYQTALRELEAREANFKSALLGMQSTVVLQGMFCEQLSGQLAAQEEKQKKRKKGQLNGDGLLRLLTGDAFYGLVIKHEETSAIEEEARKTRKKLRDERARLMEAWKEADKKRLERNNSRREAYHHELGLWTAECARAKVEKRRPGWTRPKLGKLESPIPKPVADSTDGDEAEGENGEADDENNGNNGNNEDDAQDNESDGGSIKE